MESDYIIDDVDCITSGFDVLMCMPKIGKLTYSCHLHMAHVSKITPKALPELLGNLKTVSLRDMDAFSTNEISFMFCIMRSSPNLENLEIHMDDSYNYKYRTVVVEDSLRAVITYLEVEAKEEMKTSITTVSVIFKRRHIAERIGAEIALVDSILSYCPSLGKLVIKGSSSTIDSAKLQLSRILERCGQSSCKPKIIYLNS
ncbi:unnamed protein product [Rhodiola kirilowii]